jgi:glycosyltransferase involved in cell wall biosynthesis
MRVLYFGTYSTGEGYPRNNVIIRALKKSGIDVVECHEPLWRGPEEKVAGVRMGVGLIKFFPRLLLAYLLLMGKFFRIRRYDLIIVGYSGHIDIFLAKLLNIFKRKPLVFDAFLSLYDTAVLDRKIVKAGSFMARILWWIDKVSCASSDLVLLDTYEHITFFVDTFQLPRQKFSRVFAGTENEFLVNDSREAAGKGEEFRVLFFGTYIPLHGIETIVKTAQLLQDEEDIHFLFIGKGQLLPDIRNLAESLGVNNITFIEQWVSPVELKHHIHNASVCLGIFGETGKAKRVIPLKVYGCLSQGKALITGDTPAARELLRDKESGLLVPLGDPASLANAILKLKKDKNLLERIGREALKLFKKRCSIEVIGGELAGTLEALMRNKGYNV